MDSYSATLWWNDGHPMPIYYDNNVPGSYVAIVHPNMIRRCVKKVYWLARKRQFKFLPLERQEAIKRTIESWKPSQGN